MGISIIGGGTAAAIGGGAAIDAGAMGLLSSGINAVGASDMSSAQQNATNTENAQLQWLQNLYSSAQGQLQPGITQNQGLPMALDQLVGYNPSTGAYTQPSQLTQPLNALAGLTGYNPTTGSYTAPTITTPTQLQQGYNLLDTNLLTNEQNQAAQMGLTGTAATNNTMNAMNQILGGQLIQGYGAGQTEQQNNIANLLSYITNNASNYQQGVTNLSGLSNQNYYTPIQSLYGIGSGIGTNMSGITDNIAGLQQGQGSIQAQGLAGIGNSLTGAASTGLNAYNNANTNQTLQQLLTGLNSNQGLYGQGSGNMNFGQNFTGGGGGVGWGNLSDASTYSYAPTGWAG